MSSTTTQFTVPAVAEAVAAAIPSRDLLIHGDRRYTYGKVIERSNVFRKAIERSPSGKADYQWAREQAENG